MNDFEWLIWVCYPLFNCSAPVHSLHPTVHITLLILSINGHFVLFCSFEGVWQNRFGAVPISGDTPSLFQASSWSHFGFVCVCVRHCLFKKWPLVKYRINTCLLCSRWGSFSVRVPGGCSFHFTPADWRHSHLAKMLWFLAVVSAALPQTVCSVCVKPL